VEAILLKQQFLDQKDFETSFFFLKRNPFLQDREAI
jgi:hypothetical protein